MAPIHPVVDLQVADDRQGHISVAADLGNALVMGRHHLFDDLFFELRAIGWHISIFPALSVD
jgi:hypothetical protein